MQGCSSHPLRSGRPDVSHAELSLEEEEIGDNSTSRNAKQPAQFYCFSGLFSGAAVFRDNPYTHTRRRVWGHDFVKYFRLLSGRQISCDTG